MEEVYELGPDLFRRLTTMRYGMGRTVLEMICQQQLLGRTQCRVNRRELLHDLRTVPLVLHLEPAPVGAGGPASQAPQCPSRGTVCLELQSP